MVDNRMRLVAVVVFLALLIPILVTPIVPAIDFYKHMLRYYALAGAIEGAEAFYAPSWRILPNLGLDVIGLGVAHLLPPLEGARLILALLVAALFWGGLAAAAALSGRMTFPAIAILGIASYSQIFSWGFSNFLLGLALALVSYAVWARMEARPVAQIAVAAALGLLIMVVHAFSFMLYGLLLACHELGRLGPERRDYLVNLPRRWLRLAPVAVPAMAYFLASATAGGDAPITSSFSNLAGYAKTGQLLDRLVREAGDRIYSVLRVSESGFLLLDLALGAALWAALAFFVLRGAFRIDRRMVPALILFGALVFLMPPNFFGVGVVDDRMPLVLLCLVALSLRPGDAGPSRAAPLLLAGLLTVKIGAMTASYAMVAPRYEEFLARLPALQPGGIANAQLPEDWESRKFCAPLAPVAGMLRSVGVPTFANPTQQPIRLAGPLKAALAAPKGQDAFAAGFDYLFVCEPHPGRAVIEGRGWQVLAAP